MATTYNGPPTGGQPDTPRASLRVADQLLLASCAVSENAQRARLERRLRDATLRFVIGGPRAAGNASRLCLENLLEESGMSAAFVVVLDVEGKYFEEILAAGDRAGADLFHAPPESLLASVLDTSETPRTLEIPGAEDASHSPAAALCADSVGLRSMRWSMRALADQRVLVVALHDARAARYWTGHRRQFHDGIVEIFAAVLPALRRATAPRRRRSPREAPVSAP
jgi:hypothetical protein